MKLFSNLQVGTSTLTHELNANERNWTTKTGSFGFTKRIKI